MLKKSLTVFLSVIIFCMGCSGSRMSSIKNKEPEAKSVSNEIRLLVDENINGKEILIEVPTYIYSEGKKTILVNPGNKLFVSVIDNRISLTIQDKFFEGRILSDLSKRFDSVFNL